VITTLLGSCVAVCLWSSDPRVGGMNHYLLPRAPQREGSARYGDTAMALLLSRLDLLGGRNLSARIYGGATVARVGAMRLGEQNVEIARRFLHDQRIRVIDEDVFGDKARRIELDLETGDVRVTVVGTA
jgi:chemotaxis receptor (MCP) glutamine deamidase CheD